MIHDPAATVPYLAHSSVNMLGLKYSTGKLD